jgi:hypothetical protein
VTHDVQKTLLVFDDTASMCLGELTGAGPKRATSRGEAKTGDYAAVRFG